MDKKMTIKIPNTEIKKYLKEFPRIKRKWLRKSAHAVSSPPLKHHVVDEKLEREIVTLPAL